MNVHNEFQCDNTTFLDKSQGVLDRLNVMKVQEATTYRCSDYLASAPTGSHHVDAWCRSKMIEWCFQVIDFVVFSRATVLIAINYLDRFMSSGSPRARKVLKDRKEYQLAMMTALYMAIKLHEPKLIDMSLLGELSRGSYREQDFKQMEIDLLSGLKWRLAGPTAITFLEHYIVLLPLENYGIPIDDVLQSARYQIEVSVIDYGFVGTSPSKVAVAALIQSIKAFTASTRLASRRSKVLRALQDLCGTDLGSASIREILRQMECYEGLKTIPCRRHSASQCILGTARIGCGSLVMKESHSCSPKGVSN